MLMYDQINALILELENQTGQIPSSRREALDGIAQHFSSKIEKGEIIQPLVVCTHNSRRSHMGQLWFAAAAEYYGVQQAKSYSAGTEATELNPRVVAALKQVGFKVSVTEKQESNPTYTVSWSLKEESAELFSKTYQDESIPNTGVTAIMVCTDADENCPFIPGADARFPLPFEDPKVADGTPQEASRYLESLHEIGREIIYIVKKTVN